MKFSFPFVPQQASTLAAEHDFVFFWITFWLVFFTVIVSAVVIFFALRYQHGKKVDRSNPPHGHTILEISWSLPPLVLGLVTFFLGAQLFIHERVPPKDCYEVSVIGKQWMWHIQHPNGIRENNTLHIPLGKPVRVTMISQDVIHAFYIPEFRVQFYTVPGRYTQMWFQATKVGTYHLFCNLYCGTQHSEMGGSVVVMNPKDFAAWLANGGDNATHETLEETGAKLFSRYACNNCHTNVDTERGPTLNGVAGTKRTMTDGSTIMADQTYLRESILRPWDHLTKGYGNTMPAYAGQISEEDVLAITSYIRSLSTATAASAPVAAAVQTGEMDRLPVTSATPTMAAGAIGASDSAISPQVRDSNLAVGALATPKGDANKR